MNADVSSFFSPQSSSKDKTSTLPDPFVLYSTTQMPTSMSNVLKLCEVMWAASGQYKLAMQRIVRYFLTRVVFDGVPDNEKKRYEEYFMDQLKIMLVLAELGDDFSAYGNSMSSFCVPFNRIVYCDICKFSRSITNVPDKELKLDVKKKKFKIGCPRCKKETEHTHEDKRSTDENRVSVIRWSPHEIELLHNFIGGDTSFLWKVPRDYTTNITGGKAFWLRNTPWEVIETAISPNPTFQFNDNILYHMKEPTLAGIRNAGWGIPRMLAAFKNIYYLQILHRYNEALALDWIVPFRLLTPAREQSLDPLMQYDMSQWSSQMTELLSKHRKDPNGWHTMPFPVKYQTLSGEGASLAPWQLIKQGTSDMMDALGVPVELFQGSLQIQAAPLAARLFEAQWTHLASALNGAVQWMADKVSMAFGWQPVKAKLQPPTLADDLERKHILVQMASAGQISKETGYAPLRISWEDEIRRQIEEERTQQRMQREFQEQQEKVQELEETMAGPPPQDPSMGGMGGMPQQGGMAPPVGGAPGMMMPGQGSTAVTPQELLQEAQVMAEQFMGMPETIRKSQLIQLKRNNPMLHAQVTQVLRDKEQQASTQGVAMMRQEYQQQQ